MSKATTISQQQSASPQESSLSVSQIHTLLSNDRRRLVIEEVKRVSGDVTVRDVSERIAAYESGESPPPRKLRQSVYVSLIQTHLPKLEASGVISYDEQQKIISTGTETPRISRHMGVVTDPHTSWECSAPCLGICLGMLGLGMGVVGYAFGFTTVSLGFWIASSLLAVAIIAAYVHPFIQNRLEPHLSQISLFRES